MIAVAPNFFSPSINRDSHSNSGRVETPREGSIFEVEEMCLVKIHEQSMNLAFAKDDLFGSSYYASVSCRLRESTILSRNFIKGASVVPNVPIMTVEQAEQAVA